MDGQFCTSTGTSIWKNIHSTFEKHTRQVQAIMPSVLARNLVRLNVFASPGQVAQVVQYFLDLVLLDLVCSTVLLDLVLLDLVCSTVLFRFSTFGFSL